MKPLLIPEGVVAARDRAEQILLENNIEKKMVLRSMLMIEEILMLVYGKSGEEKKVIGECAITVSPEIISVIIRNDGEELDVAEDGEMSVTSLRSYVMPMLINQWAQGKKQKHMMGVSFNRDGFALELKTGEARSINE